jgi:hypothetical protein
MARLWLVLLCALGLTLPSATLAMGAQRLASVPAAEVTIHADVELPSPYLQSSDVAELLAKLERTLVEGTTGALPMLDPPHGQCARGTARGARASDDETRWCDVVQCRRVTGAQLLRYATPPPVPSKVHGS